MLPRALQAGINYSDYWDLTYDEIVLHIEADQEKVDVETKRGVISCYTTAQLTAMFVLNGLNGKKSPSINELFPDLFKELVQKNDDIDYQRAMMYKEQMLDYAKAHNKRRKAKEGE